MRDLLARSPHRPLLWPDIVFELHDLLAGSNQSIYVIGGAVRDALLHRPLKDIDLATDGDSLKLARKIANLLKGDFFVLDEARGVGRTLVDTPEGRLTVDVARFRGEDLLADLSDRDFTINAMAVDLTGDLSLLIDPLNGESDIQVKQIRRCSTNAISHDPIRALRAIRQSLQFNMRIEPETLSDIRKFAPKITESSSERIRDELIKLLSGSKPTSALRLAERLGLLDFALPEVKALRGMGDESWSQTLSIIEMLSQILTAISPYRSDNTAASFGLGIMVMQLDRYRAKLQEHIGTLWPNERPHTSLLILAILLRQAGVVDTGMIAERAAALRLSNMEMQRLTLIVQYYERALQTELDLRSIHRFWRHLGAAGVDICLLGFADYLGKALRNINQDAWLVYVEHIRVLLEAFYEHYDEVVAPPLLLDGNQIIKAFNLRPGPVIGQVLDLIREGQAAREILTVEDALKTVEAYLQNQRASS
jgi:hypothetical protein